MRAPRRSATRCEGWPSIGSGATHGARAASKAAAIAEPESEPVAMNDLAARHAREMRDAGVECIVADQHRGDADARCARAFARRTHSSCRRSRLRRSWPCWLRSRRRRRARSRFRRRAPKARTPARWPFAPFASPMKRTVSLNSHRRMRSASLKRARTTFMRPALATSSLVDCTSKSPTARSLIEPERSNRTSMSRSASVVGAGAISSVTCRPSAATPSSMRLPQPAIAMSIGESSVTVWRPSIAAPARSSVAAPFSQWMRDRGFVHVRAGHEIVGWRQAASGRRSRRPWWGCAIAARHR